LLCIYKRKKRNFQLSQHFVDDKTSTEKENHHIDLDIQSDDALQHETYWSDTARQLR
jgi:hypothetical protein